MTTHFDPTIAASLAAQAREDDAQRKLSALAEEYIELEAKNRALTSALDMVRTAHGNVWRWQGDGCDHLESLSCPVVMSADTLNAIVAQRDAALAECERMRAVWDAAKVWHAVMTERNGDYENNAPTREQYQAHDEAVRQLMDVIEGVKQ